MASLSTRTLVHYSKERITDLQNVTQKQRDLLKLWGKPMGFWYAYGEDWKEYVHAQNTGNNNQRGHTKKNTAVRHVFLLPEEAFVTEMKEASPHMILELSKANLDAFMKRFVKKTHRHTLRQVLEIAFMKMGTEGGPGHILHELSEKDEGLGQFVKDVQEMMEEDMYAELMDWMGMMEEDDVLEKGLVQYVFTHFKRTLSGYSPSREAQTYDEIHLFDWGAFWTDVSRKIGGVEFHSDLFDVDSWEKIWLPWADKLSVRSGVIFHPSRFRGGTLVEQLASQVMGGTRSRRRQEGRTRRQRRQETTRRKRQAESRR